MIFTEKEITYIFSLFFSSFIILVLQDYKLISYKITLLLILILCVSMLTSGIISLVKKVRGVKNGRSKYERYSEQVL